MRCVATYGLARSERLIYLFTRSKKNFAGHSETNMQSRVCYQYWKYTLSHLLMSDAVPGLATNERLGIRRGKVQLTGVDLRAMFEPVFTEVLALVVAQIKAAKVPVKAILLVGGFGDNAYLRDSIQQEVHPYGVKVMQTQNGYILNRDVLDSGLITVDGLQSSEVL